MTRTLVVGQGSIGQRHARLLAELGCEVVVVSRRDSDQWPRFPDLKSAFAGGTFDYVVIATETVRHSDDLETLADLGFVGPVLVEKPLALDAAPLAAVPAGPVHVAYNLRFHPVLTALRQALSGQRVLSVQAYCGQYLPSWRPGTDYRQSYSASPEAGGGVLRDLSHELDYLLWLFGPWRRLAATGGRTGTLEIRSDDSWAILLEQHHCPVVSVQINYFDRPGQRSITVNTADHTYRADLVRSVLITDGVEQGFDSPRDLTYLAQHRAVLAGAADPLCDLAQGQAVMACIAAVETASRTRQWIERT